MRVLQLCAFGLLASAIAVGSPFAQVTIPSPGTTYGTGTFGEGASGTGGSGYGQGAYGPGAYGPGAYGPGAYGPGAYGPGAYRDVAPPVSSGNSFRGAPALPKPRP